jgi:hypothetical protein
MNFLRILIMLFPMFCFASFPIQENIQFIDTVLVNEKLNEAVVVYSTSKYPLEKETLTEYRARLKKQLYSSSSEELYNCFFNLALYSVKVSFSRGYLLVE